MGDLPPEESKGDYEYDLHLLLNGPIDTYEQDRKNYWAGKGPGYQIEYDRAERFAKFVLEGVKNLTSAQKIDEDLAALQYEATKEDVIQERFDEKLRNIKTYKDLSKEEKEEIFQILKEFPEKPDSENSPLHLVWERFCIDLAWEAIDKMEKGANRMFNLYKLMLTFRPSRSTIGFLLRLSRCYIWGFDPECVILCRSVLDTALREKISPEICEKHFGRRQFGFNLSDRIHAAAKEGLIDDATKSKTLKVKERGDKAVHYQPDITKDVWGTICDTVSVLEVLFSK
ncbi:MAG: hypothetical protein MUO27_12260 [Sedimentisphaerales bacterium]|nr:hypothetical protein [Sedimentisphaerales bacterium]